MKDWDKLEVRIQEVADARTNTPLEKALADAVIALHSHLVDLNDTIEDLRNELVQTNRRAARRDVPGR